MTYHSAQVHLAVTRLISAKGIDAEGADLECNAVDRDGIIAYRITARGHSRAPIARLVREALGEDDLEGESGAALISVESARRLIETAYS